MSVVRFLQPKSRLIITRLTCSQLQCYSSQTEEKYEDEEFRVLNLRQTEAAKTGQKRRINKEIPLPPRAQKMAVDQDWGSVWPGPRTFHPATVPLPLRQGFTEKGAPHPSKYANAELMKIPNFLHLTPPVIKRQCEALKKFCTPWPKGLENEAKWEKHFPVEVITSDYCHGLPTIRNNMARIVSIRIKLSTLKLDKHARDKFLRLVGNRYNPDTDVLTIVTDRCPLRKQNYDYTQYLLTALYHEAWITEPWERTKSLADMEYYDFNTGKSKQAAEAISNWGKSKDQRSATDPDFGKSVENLINDGENEYNIQKYKEQVVKLLGLSAKGVQSMHGF